MSSRQHADRHRPRRPRYEPDDYSDSDSEDYYNDRRPARSSRPRAPPPGEDFAPAPRRGPPVPVDDPEYQPAPQDRPRSRSKVRLREPSVSSDSDTASRRQQRRPRGSKTDLERKDSPEHHMFRSKRDGYLSDEGEALRQSRRKPRARRERDDSDSEGRDVHRRDRLDPSRLAPGAAGAAAGLALPHRGNPRAKSMEPPPPYPSDNYGPPSPRGHRRAEYDTDPDGPSRRRTTREPRREPRESRPRYDDYYDESPPPRRREDGRRARGGYPEDRDRGYKSDHGGRRRDDDYRRPERDPYDRRSRGDGYRSDHGPSRRDAYDDPRDSGRRRADPRRDYGDDRRVDDRRDRYRSSRGSKKKGGVLGGFKLDDATDMFLTYGLPILKKEGPKWAKQAQGYWAKRGGGI